MLGGHFGMLLAQRDLRFDRWGIMGRFSDERQLYLDFDFKRPDRRSPRLGPMWAVMRIVGIRIRERGAILYERSRHGWHVIIPTKERLIPSETVALQLAMGSDGRREALNLMRALAIRCYGVTEYWKKRFNILFDGKI